MQIITRNGCPYPRDYMHKMLNEGFEDQHKIRLDGVDNLRQAVSTPERRAAKEKARQQRVQRFMKRPGRVPWPWEK